MSKGKNKKNRAQDRIIELDLQKRNGLLVTAASFVGIAVIIALKLYFQYEVQAAWADTPAASIVLFILAIVAAAIAGWGTRKWRKARDEIRVIRSKYNL